MGLLCDDFWASHGASGCVGGTGTAATSVMCGMMLYWLVELWQLGELQQMWVVGGRKMGGLQMARGLWPPPNRLQLR